MRLRDLNNQPIGEGVNDPGIFCAVFLAGGPGSGKTYIADGLGLKSLGLKSLNIDDAFTFLMNKHGLDLKQPSAQGPETQSTRQRAASLTSARFDNYIAGRLGLIIDGTSARANRILETKNRLEQLGYRTMMVFVDTELEVAHQRNQKRSRSEPHEVVDDLWKRAQAAKAVFDREFGGRLVVVDNSTIYTKHNEDFQLAAQKARQMINQPLTPTAQSWVDKQRQGQKLDQMVSEVTESWHLNERLVQKNKDGEQRWALVSKDDASKVLKWFGSQKPSDEAVEQEERRVQAFKHMDESQTITHTDQDDRALKHKLNEYYNRHQHKLKKVLDLKTDYSLYSSRYPYGFRNYLFVMYQGEPIGFLILQLDRNSTDSPTDPSREYQVETIFILRDHRRQGLAEKIYQYLRTEVNLRPDDYQTPAMKNLWDKISEDGPRMVRGPREGDPLSTVQLNALEKYADRLFGKLGIDVEFTRHFRDRINDARNGKQITYQEMISFFNRAFEQHGGDIQQLDPISQAVLKDLSADINVPFVFKWDRDGPDKFELVTKTVMRKPNFSSPNNVYPITEGAFDSITNSTSFKKLVKTLEPVTNKLKQFSISADYVRKVYINLMLGRDVGIEDIQRAGEELQDWLRTLGLGFIVAFPLTPPGTLAVLAALKWVQDKTGTRIFPAVWDEELEQTRERLRFDARAANYNADHYQDRLSEFLKRQ